MSIRKSEPIIVLRKLGNLRHEAREADGRKIRTIGISGFDDKVLQ